MIEQADFDRWKQDVVTREVYAFLERMLAEEKGLWANASFEDSDMYKAAKQNAAALGRVEAYSQILGLTFSQMEIDDGK